MDGSEDNTRNIKIHQVESRPGVLPGWVYKTNCGCGNLYIGVSEKNGHPFEIFVSFGKSGRCANVLLNAVMILASRALRAGLPIEQVIKTFIGLRCDNPIGAMENKGKPILSCVDAIAKILMEYLENRPSQNYKSVDMEKEFYEMIGYAEKAMQKIKEGDIEQAYYLNGVIFGKWMTLGREVWDKHMQEYNKITAELNKQLLERKKNRAGSPTKIEVASVAPQPEPLETSNGVPVDVAPESPKLVAKGAGEPTLGGMGIIGGKICKQCGGGPIVKKGGCEVCVSCGDEKCGGS